MSIDDTHDLNLPITLDQMVLIDADLVAPECPCLLTSAMEVNGLPKVLADPKGARVELVQRCIVLLILGLTQQQREI